MSIFRTDTILFKLSVWMGAIYLLALVIIVYNASNILREHAVEAAQNEIITFARLEAEMIQDRLDRAFGVARTLAHVLSTVPAHPGSISREQANDMLRRVLEENPDILGVYTGWEPDAFDGRDAEFANMPGYDETGRLIPYWTRGEDGSFAVEPLLDYEVPGDGDWYLKPRATLQEQIIDPFLYPVQGVDVLMTPLVVPIVADGEFVGITGADMKLDFLQTLTDMAEIQQGEGTLLLISNNGTLAGVTGQPQLVGQSLSAYYPDNWRENLGYVQGQTETFFIRDEVLSIFVPIQIGRTNTPWAANINVPMSVVTAQATEGTNRLAIVGFVMYLVGVTGVRLMVRLVIRPIQNLTGFAQKIADGDLSVTASVRSNDELGLLADSFNQMVKRLREMLADEQEQRQYLESTVQVYVGHMENMRSGDLRNRIDLQDQDQQDPLYLLGEAINEMTSSMQNMIVRIRKAATDLNASMAQLQAATTEQTASATQQNAAISQTAVTMEEVRATVNQTAERAQTVADASQQSVEVSRGGLEAISDTIEAMNLIRERVTSIAETILMLSERTQQIGEIIESVNEIADQSKLLALNASIEAARAGTEGKGFAVVAMEVRQLAEQSRTATSRVSSILNEIQKATNAAVMVTEEGSKGVDSGVQMVEHASQSIRELAEVINTATLAATQIAASTHQQINGINQLVTAMEQIKVGSNQSVVTMRQAEEGIRVLVEMAKTLEATAVRYRA